MALNKSAQPLACPLLIPRTLPDLQDMLGLKAPFFWLPSNLAPPLLLKITPLTTLPSFPCRQMNPSAVLFHILKIFHFKSHPAHSGHHWTPQVATQDSPRSALAGPRRPSAPQWGDHPCLPLCPVAHRSLLNIIKDETSMGSTWRMWKGRGKATSKGVTSECTSESLVRVRTTLLKRKRSSNHWCDHSLYYNIKKVTYIEINLTYKNCIWIPSLVK